MAESSPCINCINESGDSPSLDEKHLKKNVGSLLLLDNKGPTARNSKSVLLVKPSICRLPESDVMARMKAFVPFLSETKVATDSCDSAVEFVPLSESGSDDESDSSEASEDEGPHVEMRLAVVANNSSDSEEEEEEEVADDAMLFGEVTAENMRISHKRNDTNTVRPTIEELN